MRMRNSCWNTYSPTLNEYIPGNSCLSKIFSMSAEFGEWVESTYSLKTLHQEHAQFAYDCFKRIHIMKYQGLRKREINCVCKQIKMYMCVCVIK